MIAPKNLSPRALRLFSAALQEDLIPVAGLRSEISDYVADLTRAALATEFIDLDTARLVATLCGRLLDRLAPDSPDEHRRAVQAAVRYFVLPDDAESDIESPIGFDDDLAVVEAVAQHVGADDLLSYRNRR